MFLDRERWGNGHLRSTPAKSRGVCEVLCSLPRGVISIKQNFTLGAKRNPWPVHILSCDAWILHRGGNARIKQNLTCGTRRNPWPVHILIQALLLS